VAAFAVLAASYVPQESFVSKYDDSLSTSQTMQIPAQNTSDLPLLECSPPLFQVKVTETTKVAVLPDGFKSFAVGAVGQAYSGLTIDVDAGTITNARLTTSAADVTAALSIAAGMQAACLRFDAKANSYTFIEGTKYNFDKTMTVDLPSAGFYAFVSASLTVPIPTIYAQARTTNSSASMTIVYGGGELELGVQTTNDNSITCTKKERSDAAAPADKASINIYFDIELKTKEEKVKKGEIKYKYNAAAVVDVRTLLPLYAYD